MPLLSRRYALVFLAFAFFAAAPFAAHGAPATGVERKLAALEASVPGSRLGVSALNTDTGARIQHRADERFPFASTFKVMLVATILKRGEKTASYIDQRVRYTENSIVVWSPITEERVDTGMTVWELCEAAIRYSDNTAANLLMQRVGGPKAVNAFAASIGDKTFSLVRWEPELNAAEPGDERDTTTPAAMEKSLGALVLGNALQKKSRALLVEWLNTNTTGDKSIRAGLPPAWKVGDKTGGGAYGTTNDIAVIHRPNSGPIVMAIYFTQKEQDALPRHDVLAAVARLIAAEWP